MEWQEPIYNRSATDLLQAEQQIKRWIQSMANGQSIMMTDLRGCLNASDLNRISNNIQYLYSKLVDLSYSTYVPALKEWTINDIPNKVEINDIINTLGELTTRLLPTSFPQEINDYADVNELEYLLKLMRDLVEIVLDRKVYVGTTVASPNNYATYKVVAVPLPYTLWEGATSVSGSDSIPFTVPSELTFPANIKITTSDFGELYATIYELNGVGFILKWLTHDGIPQVGDYYARVTSEVVLTENGLTFNNIVLQEGNYEVDYSDTDYTMLVTKVEVVE